MLRPFSANIPTVIRAYFSHNGAQMITCTVSMVEASVAIVAASLPRMYCPLSPAKKLLLMTLSNIHFPSSSTPILHPRPRHDKPQLLRQALRAILHQPQVAKKPRAVLAPRRARRWRRRLKPHIRTPPQVVTQQRLRGRARLQATIPAQPTPPQDRRRNHKHSPERRGVQCERGRRDRGAKCV